MNGEVHHGEKSLLDVVLPLKNANPLFLKRCLDSVFSNVPVNRLIVVNGGNTTSIISLLTKEYGAEFIEDREGNRATARQKAIESIQTDWHLHVDGDVVLCSHWFQKARFYMNQDDVGLIWGWDRIAEPHTRNRMKAMYYLRHIDEYELMKRNFQHRGGMHDTLLRTSAVKGIHIPSDLHVFEDWYIRNYIVRNGYRSIAPESLWCFHYPTPNFTYVYMKQIAQLQRKYKIQ